jgi:hypothetical protein
VVASGHHPREAIARRFRALASPVAVLAALVAIQVVVFGALTWAQHSNFGTFAFDMGLYDQRTWSLSRSRSPS